MCKFFSIFEINFNIADKNSDGNLDENEYIEFAKLRADFNENRYGEALRYTD